MCPASPAPLVCWIVLIDEGEGEGGEEEEEEFQQVSRRRTRVYIQSSKSAMLEKKERMKWECVVMQRNIVGV